MNDIEKKIIEFCVKGNLSELKELYHENPDINLSLEDVSLVIAHQANYRILQTSAKRMGMSMDKMYVNIHKYGNTTAATIPIAMCEALEEGKFTKGDIIILTAFGAGYTWASAAIRW